MFVCFDCGDGFKTNNHFLGHSCDVGVSSFETNFAIVKKENISDQGKIKSTQKENATVNNQQGGYIKCPMKCKKLFSKDQFMVPIALRDHVIKRHKNEEHSELFQKIVNQAPSELKCDICGKLFGSLGVLKQHYKRTHSEEKMVSCPKCKNSDKMYKTS